MRPSEQKSKIWGVLGGYPLIFDAYQSADATNEERQAGGSGQVGAAFAFDPYCYKSIK